jgi:rRNA processing protein Gar1
MDLLGEILHFSKSGRLIVKLDRFDTSIKNGQNVSNEEGKKIGKITEFIGPISSPYASILPFIQKKNKLTGKKVYIEKNFRKKHSSKTNYSKIKRNKK